MISMRQIIVRVTIVPADALAGDAGRVYAGILTPRVSQMPKHSELHSEAGSIFSCLLLVEEAENILGCS